MSSGDLAASAKAGRSHTAELSLGQLVRDVHRALQAAFNEALRPHGYSLRQAAVLAALMQSPGQSNAELARGFFMTPQSMVDLLKAMEDAGLIIRRPPPAGGRVLPAELTPAGVHALRTCRSVIADTEARLLADLAPQERRQLRDLLERCLTSLRRAGRQ